MNWEIGIDIYTLLIAVVQSLSHDQLFATPWTATCQAPLSSTVSQSLLNIMSMESVMLLHNNAMVHEGDTLLILYMK